MRSGRRSPAGGLYLLAATICTPAAAEPIRDGMRSLLVGSGSRLHWHTEGPQRRRTIAAQLATIDSLAAHTVVVAAPVDPERQERARRLALERLLYELDNAGVSLVWIESRTAALNARDRELVAALRSRRGVSGALVVDFASPTREPMLWAPDAVAGAVGQARDHGGDREPYLLLRERITEHDVHLA